MNFNKMVYFFRIKISTFHHAMGLELKTFYLSIIKRRLKLNSRKLISYYEELFILNYFYIFLKLNRIINHFVYKIP